MWRSLVARFVRDEEVAGSNPVIPTIDPTPSGFQAAFFLGTGSFLSGTKRGQVQIANLLGCYGWPFSAPTDHLKGLRVIARVRSVFFDKILGRISTVHRYGGAY